MFSKQKTFQYQIVLTVRAYHVTSHIKLSEKEVDLLHQLLNSFPHAPRGSGANSFTNEWLDAFLKTPFAEYPAHLVQLAANATDYYGRSMLSIACENGRCLPIVEKLLELGAEVNAIEQASERIGRNERKVALHWAIANQLSFREKDSDEHAAVVKLLLDHGADATINCYEEMTVQEYATKRGYTAAVRMLELAKKKEDNTYRDSKSCTY